MSNGSMYNAGASSQGTISVIDVRSSDAVLVIPVGNQTDTAAIRHRGRREWGRAWAKIELEKSDEQTGRIHAPPIYDEIRTGHGRRSDHSRGTQRR